MSEVCHNLINIDSTKNMRFSVKLKVGRSYGSIMIYQLLPHSTSKVKRHTFCLLASLVLLTAVLPPAYTATKVNPQKKMTVKKTVFV